MCPEGFTGEFCQTAIDACANVNCQNGGQCEDGGCVCPLGFSGQFCEIQDAPSQIVIDSITLTDFPSINTQANFPWDINDGPDIYIQIRRDINNVIANTETIPNCQEGTVYSFKDQLPINLTSVYGQHEAILYDEDEGETREFMGGYFFTPYNQSSNLPSSIELSGGNAISMTLHISYVF